MSLKHRIDALESVTPNPILSPGHPTDRDALNALLIAATGDTSSLEEIEPPEPPRRLWVGGRYANPGPQSLSQEGRTVLDILLRVFVKRRPLTLEEWDRDFLPAFKNLLGRWDFSKQAENLLYAGLMSQLLLFKDRDEILGLLIREEADRILQQEERLLQAGYSQEEATAIVFAQAGDTGSSERPQDLSRLT